MEIFWSHLQLVMCLEGVQAGVALCPEPILPAFLPSVAASRLCFLYTQLGSISWQAIKWLWRSWTDRRSVASMSWGRSNGKSRISNCSDTHTSSSCEWKRPHTHTRPLHMSQSDTECCQTLHSFLLCCSEHAYSVSKRQHAQTHTHTHTHTDQLHECFPVSR